MDSLVYGLVTAGTTMAGGLWVASQPRQWLTEARLAGMMAIGAGLLLALLCFELLPESAAHGGPNAFGWVFAGIMAVLLFERYVAPRLTFLNPPVTAHAHDHDHDHDHKHGSTLLSHGAACSALGCLLVCMFFDGVAMAAGFTVSVPVGVLIAVGLACHMIPEGVLASTVVLAAGRSKRAARQAAVAAGLAFLIGMTVPALLGSLVGSVAFALPVAAGVLLYVVIAQLLPVALRTATGVPLLVAGALMFGLMIQLLPHGH